MTPDLQAYLANHHFVSTHAEGTSAQEYLSSEFRIRIVNERNQEIYVQVGQLTKPGELWFLNGVIAFLTNDDAATSVTGRDAERLTENHLAIAELLSASPEGAAKREKYREWLRDFATREQRRMAAEAQTYAAKSRPWWKLW